MVDQTEKDKIKEQVQFVIFILEGEEFGVEINQIREIVRFSPPTRIPNAPVFIEGVINLRGEVLAVMDLAKRYNLSQHEKTDDTRIIVAEIKNKIMGLIVDSVPEVLSINIDSIENTPEIIQTKVQASFIKGVAKVEDRLIVILNLEKVLTVEEQISLKTLNESENNEDTGSA